MEPAYHNGQFLILDKHSANYSYDDVIAFRKNGFKLLFVKRIVAVPGDSVRISNGILYVNDVPRNELQERIAFAGIAEELIILGENNYFVLGDNLKESKDSRYTEIGLVNKTEIKGKVIH